MGRCDVKEISTPLAVKVSRSGAGVHENTLIFNQVIKLRKKGSKGNPYYIVYVLAPSLSPRDVSYESSQAKGNSSILRMLSSLQRNSSLPSLEGLNHLIYHFLYLAIPNINSKYQFQLPCNFMRRPATTPIRQLFQLNGIDLEPLILSIKSVVDAISGYCQYSSSYSRLVGCTGTYASAYYNMRMRFFHADDAQNQFYINFNLTKPSYILIKLISLSPLGQGYLILSIYNYRS